MEYQVEKIAKQIKIEKAVGKTLKIIILAFLVVLLVVNLIMLYRKNIKGEEIPRVGKMSVFNIVSESMEPTININDLIIIKKCPEAEIKIGDIITFKRKDGSIVTHRITKIGKDEEATIYTTKGDNNHIEDEETIKHSQVYGKYLFKIKGVGNFVEELQKNDGLITVALIIIIFVIVKNTKDKKREQRKKIREKYDIKKKRDEYTQKKLKTKPDIN